MASWPCFHFTGNTLFHAGECPLTHWWRAKDSAVNNRKLQKLPGELFKAWFNVNCLASANDGVVPPIEDVAFALRLTEQRAAALLTQLVVAKLLDKVGEKLVPHDWDDHQFKSDKTDPTAPQRMKRYRERKRNDRNADRNDTVSVIRPEAEADSETEQSRPASAPIDEDLRKREAGLRAGIGAHFASRGQPLPVNMDRCLLWLTTGYAAGTVLGAVEAVLKRGKAVSTLEYFDGAIKDAHAKAAPENLQVVGPTVLVVEGTLECTCWSDFKKSLGQRLFICEQPSAEGRVVRGARVPSTWPPGYNDFGERIPPESEENAA